MDEINITSISGLTADPIARAFKRALELARAQEGATSPNPPVGCVLLDAAGIELASGAHRRAGLAHAEAEAIAVARAKGVAGQVDTVVVTLEPCNHHGRTPPCTEAILATAARNVWIACRDPNPKVDGGGAERLSLAGCRVRFLSDLAHPEALALATEAERLIAPFSKLASTGLPFLTVKQAISSRGSMIPPSGMKTFASETSLALAHRLRRRADAILTGSGTVLADDPQFTVRLVADHPDKHRLLVILDRRRRVPSEYLRAARQRGFDTRLADDVADALAMIGATGAMEVLVEAGPTLTGSLLDAGQWDEHVLIEQAACPNGRDLVTVRNNLTAAAYTPEEDTYVFRHY